MSKATKAILWIVGIVVVVLIILSASKGPKESGPIRIGFIGPLSGDLTNIGVNTKAAMEIATEEINSSGGINGRQVEIVYEDSRCTPAVSVSATNKLINLDKVVAIIGDACSSATLAAAPLVEEAKTPLISYSSTAAKISSAGDYVFRTVPSDVFQSSFAAKYAYEKLGKKKAAIVYMNNDWGIGLQQSFSEAFKKAGGEITITEGFDPATKDLRSIMSKVSGSKADILYFLSMPGSAEMGIKQFRAINQDIVIFGADPLEDITVWNNSGSAGNGAMFTTIGTNPSDQFKARMKEKVRSDEIIYSAPYAYDALKILAKVIGDVGTDGQAIRDGLYRVSYSGGVSNSRIEFDQNGDPKESNYVVKTIKDGKVVLKD